MCLRVSEDWLHSRVTEKEIVCYKVGLRFNGVVVAPFYDEVYRSDRTLCCWKFETEIVRESEFGFSYGFGEVLYGYHSFVNKEDAFELRRLLERECKREYVVLKCTIPEGTAYYEGGVYTGFNDTLVNFEELPKGYVSEKIRIVERWCDGMMVYKDISESPSSIWELLYSLRLREHKEYSIEEYVKLYRFIVVDGVVYSSQDVSRRVEEFKENETSHLLGMCYPDAIIKDGVIVKNRYGLMNLK